VGDKKGRRTMDIIYLMAALSLIGGSAIAIFNVTGWIMDHIFKS